MMMHPSYPEMITIANKDVQEGENPVVQSRFSIVIAAARRARQLVDGDEATVAVTGPKDKALSIAVRELEAGEVKVLPNNIAAETGEEVLEPEHEVASEN